MPSSGDLSWPLRRAAALAPSGEAVVDRDRRVDYATLARRVTGLGEALRTGLGLPAGQIVAMLAGNSMEYVEAWLGIPAAGLVLNPLNFRLAEAELTFILNDSGARVLVADARFFETARRLADACPAVEHLIWADPTPAPDATISWESLVATEPCSDFSADVDESCLAAISYTGGTTGLPKGVMQSHGNLLANARNLLIALPLSPRDRFFHASPMFHAAGAANVFSMTWQGGAHVVLPVFDPGAFVELAARERITSTVIVPTMLNAILNHPGLGEHDLSAWRLFQIGAAPPPVELLRRALDLLPCDIRQVYGATETSPHVSSTRDGDIRRWVAAGDEARLRSCGIPDIGVEVEIRSTDRARCATGEIGEVVVRGANVMLGYWNRPTETAAALDAEGWYRSGDLGYLDTDGYLYLVDRAKDMIISGGENVYTAEVENVLYLHPAVLEAAVFGIPHATWGEAIHAEVVTRPGHAVTAEDLITHCRAHIAGYKTPRSISLRTEPLPKSGANKILKRDLRAPFWAGP